MRKFNRSRKVAARVKKTGKINSRKVIVDGIQFASKLESYMYKALKDAGIKAEYEPTSFELIPSFHFPLKSYERQSNGKGDMINRGEKSVRGITYKPDFMGDGFVIECKGHANESFPIRWKLFKLHIMQGEDIDLYKPQSQKDCDETVRLILENQKNK